jgi:large subunit ribosomal protein L28
MQFWQQGIGALRSFFQKNAACPLIFQMTSAIMIHAVLVYYSITGTSILIMEGGSKMAKCNFCGKGVTFGIKVSHSHRRSNRTWKPNVKRVKAIVDGTPTHVYVCSRCLRSGKVTRA